MLETLILCRPELCLNTDDKSKARSIIQNILHTLGIYIFQQQQTFYGSTKDVYVQSNIRFGELLIGLRCLSLHSYESFLINLFKEIVNDLLKSDS